MSISNRAQRIEKLAKALKRAFRPVPPPTERTVLETLVYACCLEDSSHEQADEAFAKLTQTYVDWNEVRVTTVAELGELLSHLNQPQSAAIRLKRTLQSLFEKRYSFDLEELRKQNLGKAQAEVESWGGMSRFVSAYIAQHAFGGHAIPVGSAHLQLLLAAEIIVAAEADKQSVPGLERAIPKNAGVEFAGLLHQAAVALRQAVHGEEIAALFKTLKLELPPPEAVAAPAATGAKPAKAPRRTAAAADGGTARVAPPQSASGTAKAAAAKSGGGKAGAGKSGGDKPAAKASPAKGPRTASQPPVAKVASKVDAKQPAGTAKGAKKPESPGKAVKKTLPVKKNAAAAPVEPKGGGAKPPKAAGRSAAGDKPAAGKAPNSKGSEASAAKASKSSAVKLTKKKPK
jgi:endonuclease III